MNMTKKTISLLFNKNMMLVLVFGFASGLPLGLSGATLQTWYKVDGVSIVTIGLLALVGQPYVYKFIWAPLMDTLVLPFGGRRRGWLFVTQLGIIATLLAMACFSPHRTPGLMALLALGLAFFSASQDIVIDAYRTELLTSKERGTGAAMYVTGYRVAMLVSGGLALVLADVFGFALTFVVMAGLMGIGCIATLFSKEPTVYEKPSLNFQAAVIDPFKEFLSRPAAWLLLLLIIYYKLGDAFAGALTNVFLLDLGFSLKEIGITNKTVGLLATLIGAFIGGILLSRIRLFTALIWFGALQAVSNLLYMLLANAGLNHVMMVSTIFLENLCGGMGTAAFLTFIMSLCDLRYTATQFALLTALSAIGRVYITPVAGIMVKNLGWSEFYFWTFVISLPCLALIWYLQKPIEATGKINQSELPEPIV